MDKSVEIGTLIGNYVLQNDNDKTQFLWKEGPLAEALNKGQILVLDNFELANE